MNKNIIAIMYDFDKTLCTKDMQEYAFIPNLGMGAKEFWSETNKIRKESQMDQILTYMYMMQKKMKEKNIPLTKEYLMKTGENIELYQGVNTWFDRINEYGKNLGVEIEHYIISSGLKEIIDGSKIGDKFKQIFASEFYYDEFGNAAWPKLAINYTNKTQFLIRINKGVLDIIDDYSLNKRMEDNDKRIPYKNMIYIGDGLTDVPCMKLTKENGGVSIAVYTKENIEVSKELLKDERVNFAVKADYSEKSELDTVVKKSIDKISIEIGLNDLTTL